MDLFFNEQANRTIVSENLKESISIMKVEPPEIDVDNFDNLDLGAPDAVPEPASSGSKKPIHRGVMRTRRVVAPGPSGNGNNHSPKDRRVGGDKRSNNATKPHSRSVVVEKRVRYVPRRTSTKTAPALEPVTGSLPSNSFPPEVPPQQNNGKISKKAPKLKGKHPTAPKHQPPQPGREGEILTIGSFQPDALLLSTEAARILGVSPKTLDNWRWKGKGPRFVKIGGAVRYQVSELTNYIEMGHRSSTSGEGG